ncbi:Eml2 [Acrasis kona]|uniref:Eml2 n=1 Tax=Acrasis kona TaxID=1008807 RepID=A0AAW2Z3B7_9EUKA
MSKEVTLHPHHKVLLVESTKKRWLLRDTALHLLYSIAKIQKPEKLQNFKVVLGTLMVYFIGFITFYAHRGYQNNLTNIFDKYDSQNIRNIPSSFKAIKDYIQNFMK